MLRFSESVSFDRRLAPFDIAGSQAHAAMLAHVGLLTDKVRPKFEELGVLEFENLKHDGAIDWATLERPLTVGDGKVIAGFAGATADAFTLFERLEGKLERHQGQLMRAAVELAKDWRTDKYLRNLEAMLIVADKDTTLIITGNGDVLEPEAGVAAIGSGGNFALAAARALVEYEQDAETICRKAMKIAGDLCVYTNDRLTVEALDTAA